MCDVPSLVLRNTGFFGVEVLGAMDTREVKGCPLERILFWSITDFMPGLGSEHHSVGSDGDCGGWN
jgi:hypothetical protein